MTSLSLALLAVAIPVWPAAETAPARLATVTGATARRPWRSMRSSRLLPVAFALSTGTLAALLAGLPIGILVAVAAWLTVRYRRRPRKAPDDRLSLAAGWDLLAACLRAGLPVPTAVRAVADDLPAEAGDALRATADLLALGADPVSAWKGALDCAATAELARGARRTARSGTALAGVASALAASIRESASDAAEAKAQRAGVLITGPLGLCFLPAFVCLGIVPVVIGLAAQLTIHQ